MLDDRTSGEENEEMKGKEKAINELRDIGARQKKMGIIVKIISALLVCLLVCVLWWGHKALKRGPARANVEEGLQMMNRANYGMALETFKKAIEKDESYYLPYYLAGVIHYDMYHQAMWENDQENTENNLDGMYSYLEKAIAKKSDHAESHIYMGLYYYYKKDKTHALAEFDKGILLGNKTWKNTPSKKDKWVNFAEEAKKSLSGEEGPDTLYCLTPAAIEILTSKFNDPEFVGFSYFSWRSGTKDEWREELSWYNLVPEDVEEILKHTEAVIPDPPAPDELDQVFRTLM